MPYGKMPPQAYTKDTLQEAFEWWSEQPDELRAKIQDKDDLVGYYLRINRGGGESSDPVESGGFTKKAKESFSTELKGLVKNLDAFEGYEGDQVKPTQGAFKTHQASKPQTVELQRPQSPPQQHHVFEPASQLQFPEMSKPLVPTAEATQPLKVQNSNQITTKNSPGQFFRLDENSKASVAQARKLLNLSSDEEALRALIALGSAKMKSLI